VSREHVAITRRGRHREIGARGHVDAERRRLEEAEHQPADLGSQVCKQSGTRTTETSA